MKSVLLGLASLLAIATFSQKAVADSIFLDYRKYNPNEKIKDRVSISTAEQKLVFNQVIKKQDKPCRKDFQPQILDSKSGAFTAANTKETAYLVDLGDECYQRSTSTIRLAIFCNSKIVTFADVSGFRDLLQITDINGDGRAEVTVEGGWVGQGVFTLAVQVLEFTPKGSRTLAKLRGVYSNNSGMGLPDTTRAASVVYADSSSKGKIIFTRENYTATCSRESQNSECGDYELSSSGEP